MSRRSVAALIPPASHALPFAGHDPATLLSIGPQALVRADEWTALHAEPRLRTRVRAVHRRLHREGGAFARAAALALHRLPVIDTSDAYVDYLVDGTCTRHSAADVRRRHEAFDENDIVVIDGVRVTSLERTVYDVVRLGSLALAVVAFDAALRQIAWDDAVNTYDVELAERFRGASTRVSTLTRVRAASGKRVSSSTSLTVVLSDPVSR